jgi:hypothetical protein
MTTRDPMMNPELRTFINAVIVPALLERFLAEHQASPKQVAAIDLPKREATV